MQDFRMETFLTVCHVLNYTKAAELLHITQPAVSQHIKYLEHYYGAQLFCYKGKKLHLTDAGRMLCSAATTMKHDESMLCERMATGTKEKLVFGATLTIGDFIMPSKLARYVMEYPDTEVQMTVDNTETLLKKMNEGALDFAMIEGYYHKGEFDYQIYSSERYIAVCGATYTFQNAPKYVSDLFGERIILRERGSGTREIFERHIEGKNHSFRDFQQVIEIGSIHAIKAMVAAGCGITFLYETAVKQELAAGTLQQIPLEDFEIQHDFTLVWRKNSIFHDRYTTIFQALLGA